MAHGIDLEIGGEFLVLVGPSDFEGVVEFVDPRGFHWFDPESGLRL